MVWQQLIDYTVADSTDLFVYRHFTRSWNRPLLSGNRITGLGVSEN